MHTIEFNGWKLAVNREATEAAYASVETNSALECGCADCLRFDGARSELLPPPVLKLFAMLGVAAAKEAEAMTFGPDGDGRDIWSWFYHFIGRIVEVPDTARSNGQLAFTPISVDFSIGFTEQSSLVPESFRHAEDVIQVECFYYKGNAVGEHEKAPPTGAA